MDAEERDILSGLKRGNRDSWFHLYDQYAPRLWKRIARLVGGSQDVADVFQATMLAAAESVAGFDPSRGSLWMWLCGIAGNQSALYWRQRATRDRRHLDIAAVTHWLTDHAPEPHQSLESAELVLRVRQCLARLPQEYHVLLLARYADRTSAEELAASIGTTGQAIRSKLARARKAFIEEFSQQTTEPNHARQNL